MKPFHTFPLANKQRVQYVLTDIDDTLTLDGNNLPAIAYTAYSSEVKVISCPGE